MDRVEVGRAPRLPWGRAVLGAVAQLLFPPRCVATGCGVEGAWLCAGCLAAIAPLAGRRCPRCAARRRSGAHCRACRDEAPFTRASAVGPYTGVLREALHALKFRGVGGVAAPLSALAARAHGVPAPGAVVVAVPAHSSRLGGRWLDHAALLAAGVAAATGLEARSEVIVRQRATRPQVGLDPAERAANLRGAFRASPAVRGARVVLVDDVMTTGATLREVSAVLMAAGARAVDVCVVARADEEPGWPERP